MNLTWTTLCGGHLAYGSTGYEITLCTEQDKPPYVLQDPDGRILASSYRLPHLKEFCQQEASSRMEFSEPSIHLPSFTINPEANGEQV
jgi:hypothetical protein